MDLLDIESQLQMNVAMNYEIGYESLQFLAFVIIRKQISHASNNEERFLFNIGNSK